ncbi:PaaI family thioesterase [Ancylobacter oerskovii]|uniref:PaaI family thioesterase n=1 Tax=Ancylobacter oerskovii TaxID=459519 RepID=A0ABW4Z332_9HYPH|nr:PaaI family thioesterase [Ancylobacter oerskovii]MBS7546201.1 PaaI family thioesterase [Ancylobacter oerskovii]
MPDISPEQLLDEAIATSPFISFSGLKIVSVDAAAGEVVVTMPARPEFMRASGDDMFHGGPIAALIDTAGDFAIAIGVGGVVPTINFRVDYLRPARGGELRAVAKVRKAGRTVGLADVDVYDASGKLCAVGRGCYSGARG